MSVADGQVKREEPFDQNGRRTRACENGWPGSMSRIADLPGVFVPVFELELNPIPICFVSTEAAASSPASKIASGARGRPLKLL